MPYPIASAADFRFTSAAFPILSATRSTSASIHKDVVRFDPLTASLRRAVYAILRRVLLILLVPFDFEFCVKEFVHVP